MPSQTPEAMQRNSANKDRKNRTFQVEGFHLGLDQVVTMAAVAAAPALSVQQVVTMVTETVTGIQDLPMTALKVMETRDAPTITEEATVEHLTKPAVAPTLIKAIMDPQVPSPTLHPTSLLHSPMIIHQDRLLTPTTSLDIIDQHQETVCGLYLFEDAVSDNSRTLCQRPM